MSTAKNSRKRDAKGRLLPGNKANPRILENILRSIYYDPRHPAGFSSVYRLYQAAVNKVKNLQIDDVRRWLSRQSTYILHKANRLRFPRRKVLVRGPKIQFQADLLDLQNRQINNDGVRYLLTVIDCFSRLATAIPLKNKSATSTKEGLKKAFKELGTPKKLQTDRGSEFYNEIVKKYLRNKNIIHFSTYQLDTKAQMVERFNRTLRLKLDKFLHANSKSNYLSHLKDILSAYNNRKHSAFKNRYSPIEVTNKNQKKIFDLLYKDYFKKIKKHFKFKIGDIVVLSVLKKNLVKTSKTFSPSKYMVIDRFITQPPTYKIQDILKKEIKPGTFYEEQLQEVDLE